MKKLVIAADHAGFELKEQLKAFLVSKNISIEDLGTFSEESMDYPDVAHPLADAVERKHAELGILICGSANGVAMAANKHRGIRAAICWNSELAALARQHNDANVLCLPARFISSADATQIVETFLKSNFEGGRHQRRVDKVSC
jgi:ribose 5-phosphate isomerase B